MYSGTCFRVIEKAKELRLFSEDTKVHSTQRSVPNSKLVSEKDVPFKPCSEGDAFTFELKETNIGSSDYTFIVIY